MRRCVVSTIGQDQQTYSVEVEAHSLFDAAWQAHQKWALLSWFSPRTLIEVRAGPERWHVRPDRLRLWATGSTRKRRREY